MLADITDAVDDHLGLSGNITGGQLNGGNDYVFQANGFATIFADKVDVIVLMLSLFTCILANSIFYAVIRRGYGMENPFLHK